MTVREDLSEITMQSSNRLIDVDNLRVQFHIPQGIVRAVDGVSFGINRGGSLGVVGESGCGKSVTALSLMLLHPQPEARIAAGEIIYHPKDSSPIDVTALDIFGEGIRDIRGKEIAMIFQEPMTSLSPVYTIGQQIVEGIRLHQDLDKKEARELAIQMLHQVKMSAPEQRVDEYPHQLSGGMRQRAMIALALSCKPSLLIADEPTTALDVTIEAQILALIQELQQKFGMSLMIITHDLGVVGEMADYVIVMYVGKIVEKARTKELFENPLHPYTRALFRSLPKIGDRQRLKSIPGSVPNPYQLPRGCSFQGRCEEMLGECREKEPPPCHVAGDHLVYCWKYYRTVESNR
ncbi:Dipeptide transport ATP-binding protein DppD [subsurface metagenome]